MQFGAVLALVAVTRGGRPSPAAHALRTEPKHIRGPGPDRSRRTGPAAVGNLRTDTDTHISTQLFAVQASRYPSGDVT